MFKYQKDMSSPHSSHSHADTKGTVLPSTPTPKCHFPQGMEKEVLAEGGIRAVSTSVVIFVLHQI